MIQKLIKNDQKWPKKLTKKGSAHCLKISPKTWKISERRSLNRSFDTTQKETGVPLFDKTVRDFPSKTMFFRHFFVNDLARFNWGHYLKISLKPWKRQKKMVLEPFFRHHPKRNWGTPVWQNGAWFSVKKHVFFTFFHGFVILGQLVISSIYHEWTCLLDFVVRHRHTYNRARFEGKKCRTFSYMLKCVQFCCPKVNQCPF